MGLAARLALGDAEPADHVAPAGVGLGREGRMLRAVEKIGRGADAFEGTPFVLKV